MIENWLEILKKDLVHLNKILIDWRKNHHRRMILFQSYLIAFTNQLINLQLNKFFFVLIQFSYSVSGCFIISKSCFFLSIFSFIFQFQSSWKLICAPSNTTCATFEVINMQHIQMIIISIEWNEYEGGLDGAKSTHWSHIKRLHVLAFQQSWLCFNVSRPDPTTV